MTDQQEELVRFIAQTNPLTEPELFNALFHIYVMSLDPPEHE